MLEIARQKFFASGQYHRPLWLLIAVLICLLPCLLNYAGIDFSSRSVPLSAEQVMKDDAIFYAIAGGLHHALLEWTAVTIAVITAAVSLFHYVIRRDLTVPIIGLALLAAGVLDAFHTLAATRIVQANVSDSDFIPFTWVISRVFNAAILIVAALVSMWLIHQQQSSPRPAYSKYDFRILSAFGGGFLLICAVVITWATSTDKLPQTTYPNALFSRPYDVLPLALFILAGALFWAWYRSNKTIVRYALMLSIIPELATQLHMALGSKQLFDNHFNIAHFLKILAYASVLLGMLIDLISNKSPELEASHKQEPPTSSHEQNMGLHILDVGKPKITLNIQLPAFAFFLALSVALAVGLTFYVESRQIVEDKELDDLKHDSTLIRAELEQFYKNAADGVSFLSQTPPVQAIAEASSLGRLQDITPWRDRLEAIFIGVLKVRPVYARISYVSKASGKELAAAMNDYSGARLVAEADYKHYSATDIYHKTLALNPGQVYFSTINAQRENTDTSTLGLTVATPVHDMATGELFGAIIIEVNFTEVVKAIHIRPTSINTVYLVNSVGDYLIHPNPEKIVGVSDGVGSSLPQDFPGLSEAFEQRFGIERIKGGQQDEEYLGVYTPLDFSAYGLHQPLSLLLTVDVVDGAKMIQEVRDRSIVLAISLSVLVLAIAILVSRRLINSLTQMTAELQRYELSGKVNNLPIHSKNEIGVMARSFHNLLALIEYKSQRQEELTKASNNASTRLQNILNSMADAVITIDEKSRIQSYNRAAENIFGYKESDIIGQPVSRLMPEKYVGKHDQGMDVYLTTGAHNVIGKAVELSGRKENGEEFPIYLSISEIDTDEGKIFTGIIRDISDQSKLEEERQINNAERAKEKKRLDEIIKATNVGTWEWDVTTSEMFINERGAKILGYTLTELNPLSIDQWAGFIHRDDMGSNNESLSKHLMGMSDSFTGEARMRHKDGGWVWVQARGMVVERNVKGQPLRVSGTHQDINERKQLEAEREQALAEAQTSVKLKAEFLASMSHEIRTPMNGVLGMLDLLMRNHLSKQQMHYATLAKTSAQSLLTIINDILDFSKIDAGKLELEFIDFDIISQLTDISDAMALRAQEKQIELILDVRQVATAMVMGDPGRLRQIFNNLLSNAIKFTPEQGEILIHAELQEQSDDLLFIGTITDSGIGIPENKIATLFDSFTQVDASTTREYGGTGLGLAICKQLCELLGGEISASSEVGKGSAFRFTVRLQKSQHVPGPLPVIDMAGRKMLVVDDNATNREVLQGQLTSWGGNITEADSAEAALKILEQHVDDLFDVAILDMNMPHMDGAELGRRIRADKRFDSMRMIMMTSMAERGDARFFSNIGFSAYFPKPVTSTDLFNALSVVIDGGSALENAQPLVTHHNVQSLLLESVVKEKRVLLVEDNYINQEVALGLLEDLSCEIDVASHGAMALELLKDKVYDLVLMDCQMPVMDGYEATQRIRAGEAGERNKTITIIAMTANAMKGDKEHCLAMGMSDYIAKPVEHHKIAAMFYKWFGEGHYISNDEVTVDINAKKHTESVAAVVWDKDGALRRMGGKPERLKIMIGIFMEESVDYLQRLDTAFNIQSLEELRSCSHAIKGALGNLSAHQCFEVAKAIELHALEDDMDAALALWPVFVDCFAQLKTVLEQELA